MPRRTRGYASVCSSDGDIVQRISFTEARKLESTGEMLRICRECGTTDFAKKQCYGKVRPHVQVFLMTAMYRNIHLSSASLTLSDMLANVGQSTKDEINHAISLGHERSVRTKVDNWNTQGMPRYRFGRINETASGYEYPIDGGAELIRELRTGSTGHITGTEPCPAVCSL